MADTIPRSLPPSMPDIPSAETSHRTRREFRKYWFYYLCYIAVLCAIAWWMPYTRLPWPGVAVAIIAVLAAVMSVHPDMHPRHKVIYFSLMAALLLTEFRAMRKDREDVEQKALADRAAQDAAFAQVLNRENEQFGATKRGFSDTAQNLNGVLQTTQGVANLAKDNLQQVTGGNTYAYVVPENFFGPNRLFVEILTVGHYNLTGVKVVIAAVTVGSNCPLDESVNDPGCELHTTGSLAEPIDVGTIKGNSSRTLPAVGSMTTDANFGAHYVARIYAQNGITLENIELRKSDRGPGAAYRAVVFWGDEKKERKVKDTGWVEPMRR
jgi:hypothetical protein